MARLSALLTILHSAYTTAELVMDVSGSLYGGGATWADQSSKGNDVTMLGSWATTYRATEKDFLLSAQNNLIMQAKPPSAMGVTEEWTVTVSFAPDTPWTGHMTLLSCRSASDNVFSLFAAQDSSQGTFVDVTSKNFPATTSTKDGFPHIKLGKFEDTMISIQLRKAGTDYMLCAYENGLSKGCEQISGADYASGAFNLASCQGFALNQEQTGVNTGYTTETAFRGKLYGVKVYNTAIDVTTVQTDFVTFNSEHGVCRTNLELYYDAGLTSSYTGCTSSSTCPEELRDLSGNNRNGKVLSSGAKYWEAYHNGVFVFPEAGYPDTDYIELNEAALKATSGSYTIEMVISPQQSPTGNHHLANAVDSSGTTLVSLHTGAEGTDTSALRECPTGWTYHSAHCYKLVGTTATYSEAEAKCKVDKAHLMSVQSKDEFVFARGLAAAANVADFWIGAQRVSASAQYLYADATVLTPTSYFPLMPITASTPAAGLLSEWDFTKGGNCATSGAPLCFANWDTSSTTYSAGGIYLDGSAAVRAPLASPLQDRTMELWVKGVDGMRGHNQGLIGLASSTGPEFDVLSPGENDGHSVSAVDFIFYASSSESAQMGNLNGAALHEHEWVHIAATYDSAGTVTVFLNGEIYGSASIPVTSYATGDYITLGRRSDADPLASSFKGLYAKAAVWTKVLSPAEVKARYAEGNPFPKTSGTDLCAKMIAVNDASSAENVGPSVYPEACGVSLPYVCKEDANDLKFHLEPSLSGASFSNGVMTQVGISYDAANKKTTLIKDGKQVEWLAGVERPVGAVAAKGWIWNALQYDKPGQVDATTAFTGQLVSIRVYSDVLDEMCLKQNWDFTSERFHVVSKGLLVHYDARAKESYPTWGSVWKDIHVQDGASGVAHDASLNSPVDWTTRHGGCFDSHTNTIPGGPSPIALGHAALAGITAANGYTIEYRLEPSVVAGTTHAFNFIRTSAGQDIMSFQINGDTKTIEVLDASGSVLAGLSQPVQDGEVVQFGFIMLPGGKAQTYKDGVAGSVVTIGSQIDVSTAGSWYANAVPGSATQKFYGCILDIRAYDHPLTYSEIEQNYGECATCKSDTCTCALCDSECNACDDGWIGGPDRDCRLRCNTYTCNERGTGVPNAFPTISADTCLCECTDQWTGTTCETCPAQYDQNTCDACAAGLFDYPACGTCSAGHCLNGGGGNEVTYRAGDVVNIFKDAASTNSQTTSQVTMNINTNYQNGDTLSYAGSRTDLNSAWDSASGSLRLTLKSGGNMKVSDWAAVLRDVIFKSTHSNTDPRKATYTYGTALLLGDTHHWYEYVPGSYSWTQSKNVCAGKNILGIVGYLATVTSATENTQILQKLAANAWIGGSDPTKRQQYRWVTGPEAAMDGGKGMLIGTGIRWRFRAASYHNFRRTGGGLQEPTGGEYWMFYWGPASGGNRPGKWNDGNDNPGQGKGALCEFGGMPGDDLTQFSGTGTVTSSCACTCPTDTKFTGTTCETCPPAFVVENARVDVNPTLYTDTDTVAGCESDKAPFGPCLNQKNRGIHVPYLCPADDCYAVTEGGQAVTKTKATIELSFRVLSNIASQPLLGLYQMNDPGFESANVFFPHVYAKFAGTTGSLWFAQSAAGTPLKLNTAIAVNTKYMLAVAFDSTQASNKRLCVYVNGALDQCVACTATDIFLGGGHAGTDVNIQLLGAGGAGTTTAADAEITDFALWGLVRSVAQIRSSDATVLPGSSSGLLVYYRGEGVAGTGAPLTWACGEQFNAAVTPKAGLCERGVRAGTNNQANTFQYHWLKDMTGNNRHAFIVGGTFISAENCDECAIGTRTYPACDVTCDDSICNNNGVMVRKAYGCTCQCDDMWSYDPVAAAAGTRRLVMDDSNMCKTCSAPYDAAQDCKACLAGYAKYPDCFLCDAAAGKNRTHCKDHGMPVSNGDECDCVCEDGWQGATCDVCPTNFMYISGTCKECTDMYAGTDCILCTIKNNCTDHATAVASSSDKSTCDCTCRNQWGGTSCETCPAGIDPAADCGQCLPGYIGYPTCTQCDDATHCNGHSSSVTSDPAFATCLCVCKNSWSNATCDTCSPQFGGTDCDACSGNGHTYPVCEECTVTDHCNSHATLATADPPVNPTGCKCDCTNYWSTSDCSTCDAIYGGADCEECALGHVNAPTCRACTVLDDCNNRAGSVTSNAARDTCECVACHDQWTGLSCDACDMVYNQTTCDECIDQYIGYPNCTQCTDDVHCSGHSTAVTNNAGKTACECTCVVGFTGATCDQCDTGYVGYPSCTQCTDAAHCSGHSTAVTNNVGKTECVCTCNTGYAGLACDECAAGYAGYPTCVQCTVTSHCSDNAPGVSVSVDKATCVCDACNDKFTGSDCGTCDPKYDPATCAKCAPSHIDFPLCEQCTVSLHCNSRAPSVTTTDFKTCVCIGCIAQWKGDDCATCAAIYDPLTCDKCANGHIDYPTCTECTDAVHCNSNSVGVTHNSDKTLCDCTCKAGFSGATCDECAIGYIGYPSCTQCTVTDHCNGRAAAVFSSTDRTTCVCDTCDDQWTGAMCELCDAKLNQTTCASCADAHITYPTCTECTDPIHCSGNSNSVTHNTAKTECVCTCKTGFTGATCDKCAVGFSNYPVCEECTSATHCHNHAAGVVTSNMDNTACVCDQCIDQWTGAACENCPSIYSLTADCKECADGRVQYPTCDLCTTQAHCTDHATVVVASMDKSTCDCTCRNQWGGLKCDSCPAGVDPAADCGQCLPGYIGYPTCTKCDVDVHCNSHGTSVTSDPTFSTCVCVCRNMWSAATCDTCSPQFGGTDCDKCSGNGHTYPVCEECTVTDHCNAHATLATADPPVNPTQCKCDCTNYWSTSDCSTCDAIYGGADCEECALGHVNAPTCRACTVLDDCNNRAGSVTSNAARDTCECVACHDQWTGLSCDACDMVYNQTTCDVCADKHVNYPNCTQCTDTTHCSGHSDSVTHNSDKTACECTCTLGFTGASCEECASGYVGYPSCTQCTDVVHCSNHSSAVTHNINKTACTCTCDLGFAGATCDQCAAGYAGYPACTECTVAAHCSGHSGGVSVSADNMTCVCDACFNKWTGDQCELCASKYDQATCDKCHDGHIDYPTCTTCNDGVHCSGHSDSVSHNANKTACVCECKAGFQGAACDECSPGHVNYPTCTQCTVTAHCHGRAVSVAASSDKTTCVCDNCNDQWTGIHCDQCDAKFNQSNCAWCADDHVNYPTCTKCNDELHCNDNSISVTHNTDKSQCACTCKPGYAGAACEQCAAGFIGYPSCVECTVALHCSGNSGSVTASADAKTCVCGPCDDQWGGAQCNTCTANFVPATCDACQDNHMGYPACVQCTDATHCNGNSDSVTHNMDKTACDCTCRAGFAGAACDECAVGYINYPTCTECTILTHCTGHSDSVSAASTGLSCVCGNCHDQWTGNMCEVCDPKYDQSTCSACAVGYIGYPVCTLCTDPLHCNSRAASVSSSLDNTVCVCDQCADQWTGAACETCPSLFSTAADCKECADGRVQYPTCTLCTVGDHCKNHATKVVASMDKSTCDCTCRNQWGGLTCDSCPAGVDPAADCGQCLPGYIGYPTCTQCDAATHCNGHSATVTSDPTFTSCLCECRNMWSGATCKDCSMQFGGADCDVCSGVGHAFPVCEECTVPDHCSGHATTSLPDPPLPADPLACKCDCTNYWSGDKCATCETVYGGADCDECALGHVDAPTCRACTVLDDCFGRAGSVTSNAARDACECVACTDQWTGSDCNVCDTIFDQATCSACANGHVNYPTCTQCDGATHCSGHSSFVTHNADKTSCTCTCSKGFTGAACDECAAGYVGYPSCTECTLTQHCNGRSDSVAASADAASCVCGTCYHQWGGSTCDECNKIFDKTTCQTCADNHVNYPTCAPCTNAMHCNGRANLVASNADQSACTCDQCIDQWTGAACELCLSLFSTAADCKECADGRVQYPACDLCTIETHCTDHASTVVASMDKSTCDCTCRNQWGGLKCDSCPAGVDPAADCGQCLPGYIGYPTCTKCDVDVHCNSRSKTVTSDLTFKKCLCECENMWVGGTCDDCPMKFAGADCDQCSGNGHSYPICEECTVTDHCHAHATLATADPPVNPTGCKCDCTNYWSGDACGTCVDKYGGADCEECALGHVNAPTCRACTVLDDCNNRAGSVTSNAARDTCECVACHDQWTGLSCDACAVIFDQTTCDKCADGHMNYPNCTQCTHDHCNGHSSDVTHNSDKTACECTCTAAFTGESCEQCASGYVGYPSCTQCTDADHCNGRSTGVTHGVNKTECACTCGSGFAGAACDECAPGFANYPMCTECTVDQHCAGNAVNVSVSQDKLSCECGTCNDQWVGVQCDTCDPRFASTTCAACSRGHINYPNCTTCTDHQHCSAHSDAVSSNADNTECACTCSEGYAGANCSECAAGFINYPACTACTGELYCNGHSKSATSNVNNTACECSCSNAFAGATCNQCAPGYANYPACVECTVSQHCYGRASAVAVSDDNTTCTCFNCQGNWGGSACDECPYNFEQTTCTSCAVGYVNYPQCQGCDVEHHCNGRATNITSNANATLCTCTCMDQWDGTACQSCDERFNATTGCNECADGLSDYPTCGAPIGNAADHGSDDDDGTNLWWLWLLLALLLLCSSILAAVYVCTLTLSHLFQSHTPQLLMKRKKENSDADDEKYGKDFQKFDLDKSCLLEAENDELEMGNKSEDSTANETQSPKSPYTPASPQNVNANHSVQMSDASLLGLSTSSPLPVKKSRSRRSMASTVQTSAPEDNV